MRFYYADPGLTANIGHHATVCRSFTGRLKAHGTEYTVLANKFIKNDLRAELAALPFFRVSPYHTNDGDPFCGWLRAFLQGSHVTSLDFSNLPTLDQEDILYLTGCQPTHLLGLIDWLLSLPPANTPRVVVDLIYETGLYPRREGKNEIWEGLDPRVDARAAYYRFIGLHMQPANLPRLHFITEHPGLGKVYSGLLLKSVEFIAALPFELPRQLHRRGGRNPITIGILGHQRKDKGYRLMPEVFTELLETRDDIRILAHNSMPQAEAETQSALRLLAAEDPRLVLDERALGEGAYRALIDTVDLMLCPYDPVMYRTTLSGIFIESVTNGVPVVVPGHTILAEQFKKYGEMGTAFDEFTPASIVDATHAAIDRLDHHAGAAMLAAEKWVQDQGPQKFVEAVLRVAART